MIERSKFTIQIEVRKSVIGRNYAIDFVFEVLSSWKQMLMLPKFCECHRNLRQQCQGLCVVAWRVTIHPKSIFLSQQWWKTKNIVTRDHRRFIIFKFYSCIHACFCDVHILSSIFYRNNWVINYLISHSERFLIYK